MAVETSRRFAPLSALSEHKLFVGSVAGGIVMIMLARFALDGVMAGMFGVWGISLILASVGARLFLWAWGAYDR
ncbi:hypothetical protein [Halopelagius fulvigenes]|uniref:Uncharacterized protein n=1 Tax=Halopelagius fulvigenes TaxID=1198324 RepID=A0ABD5TX53_9EURY